MSVKRKDLVVKDEKPRIAQIAKMAENHELYGAVFENLTGDDVRTLREALGIVL